MNIIRTIPEMQSWSQDIRSQGEEIGFVPTMGALHDGHVSLIKKALELADKVVVSIFVNPLQFDNKEDLEKYPRGEKEDQALCEQEKVDTIFVPTLETMYPQGYQTEVSVKDLTDGLCGGSRPGHFVGVATVVLKLFNIVQPSLAVFGEKDYQQLAMIRRMVTDLDLPIQIISHPIVREQDGLAMSSRNRRLSARDRERALVLHRSIQAIQKSFQAGERNADRLLGAAYHELNAISGIKIDYAEIRDAASLEPVQEIQNDVLYAVAAFVGPVRLIDNCVLKV